MKKIGFPCRKMSLQPPPGLDPGPTKETTWISELFRSEQGTHKRTFRRPAFSMYSLLWDTQREEWERLDVPAWSWPSPGPGPGVWSCGRSFITQYLYIVQLTKACC